MRVIAFDLGSNMALCVTNGQPIHHKFDGSRPKRLAETLAWIRVQIGNVSFGPSRVDMVIYERPFARGQAATRSLWALAGLIELAAEEAGLPVVDVDPSSIKKFATGDHKASKEDMIFFAQVNGYKGDNEHEADAYCLMKFAEANAISKEK